MLGYVSVKYMAWGRVTGWKGFIEGMVILEEGFYWDVCVAPQEPTSRYCHMQSCRVHANKWNGVQLVGPHYNGTHYNEYLITTNHQTNRHYKTRHNFNACCLLEKPEKAAVFLIIVLHDNCMSVPQSRFRS